MGILSRWAMVFAAFLGKYPRKAGTGKAFIGKLSQTRCLVASLMTMVLAELVLNGVGFMAMALTTMMTFLFVRYLQLKIGGLTGDALGTVNEIVEVLILVFVILT